MFNQIIIISSKEVQIALEKSLVDINNADIKFIWLDDHFFDEDYDYLRNLDNLEKCLEIICNKLDQLVPTSLDKIKVIFFSQVDSPKLNAHFTLDAWNPILHFGKERGKPNPKAVLFSRLLLSYPEVTWAFLPQKATDETVTLDPFLSGPFPQKNELIDSRFFINLFDGIGWRNKIKEQSAGWGGRNQLAVSIDEEESYAYLHSYIAYKSGYLALPVLTMSELDRLNSLYQKSDDIALSFEDIFLNFHDRETIKPETYAGQHLSNLERRDSCLPFLPRIEKRIFVTVGHHQIKWHKNNQAYIKKLKAEGHKIKVLYKPSGGIFNILEKSGLINEFWKYEQRCLKKSVESVSEDKGKRHSAPGRLLLIAQKLISRAEKIFNEASSAKECIHGAMLALEAQELLGYRTPTTCLEAIALKHKLEVKAECMFYGVGYNIDMKNRFKEIEGEVKAVSQWFHPSVRKKSLLNGQLGILTEIVEILRDYGQFDEEIQCLKRIRKLNRQFYFLNHPLLRIVQPLRAYIETLVSSFPLFIGALFFWPVFYGLLSWVCRAEYETSSNTAKAVGWYVANAFYSFFGLQPSFGPSSTSAHVISLLIVITGFLHLGIFISYLYSLIFRK